MIAKFYRPGRWSDEAILEEHAFAAELDAQEIPVVPALTHPAGGTLNRHAGFRFALYPNRPGRAPELDDEDTLRWLGRFLARLHAVGARRPFRARPELDIERLGSEPVAFLLDSALVPADLREPYAGVARAALERIARRFEEAGALRTLRLHGDCHPGNILWTDAGPHFVDLDDAQQGPAVQDLWMLLSGSREDMQRQLGWLLEGYADFRDFDFAELHLVESLRTLRMIHYAAWLARRWDDPAFPMHFPWFGTQRYWQDHVLALREQLAALDEPALCA